MPESVLLGRVCSKKKETHYFKCVRIKSFGYKLILSLVNLVLMIFVVSVVTVWVPWAFLPQCKCNLTNAAWGGNSSEPWPLTAGGCVTIQSVCGEVRWGLFSRMGCGLDQHPGQ